MSKNLHVLAAIALIAAATSVQAQDAAPGSANDITKQIQQDRSTGANPATDQGIKVPDKTDDSIAGKVQRDSPAIRQGDGQTTNQGPVQDAPAGTAHPKALPGTGNVPKGS